MTARSNKEDEMTKWIDIYKELHNLKRQISQTVVTYEEIRDSLLQGKTIHSLSQGVLVRDHITQRRREIALLGERIAEIPAEAESFTARLLESIEKSTKDFVMELMALPQLPTQEEVDGARHRRFSQDHIPTVIVSEH
ncbi:hypothetical protein O0L34_g7217 [Tuta absoluta]|nr:hypothetical protein O0L34_g7217 [Tuta absoluta]